MQWLADLSTCVSFITLVMVEIILEIDNLIFIAILSDKLVPNQRDKARILGLILALLMRIFLLFMLSWISSLSNPIFPNSYFSLSIHDVLLLLGGIFLLFKSVFELFNRLKKSTKKNNVTKKPQEIYSSFWMIVLQIAILDAIFSIDSVITAGNMVENSLVRVVAVTIAMIIIILASHTLTVFLHANPKIILFCLAFLMLIGISLLLEILVYKIPKVYLYLSFSSLLFIELFYRFFYKKIIKFK